MKRNAVKEGIFVIFELNFCLIQFIQNTTDKMENNESKTSGENTIQNGTLNSELENMNCSSLSDYIVQSHHQYAYQAIPKIQQLVEAVIGMHGAKHSELKFIKSHFWQLSNELQHHMRKEELVLFPYMKKLDEAELSETQLKTPVFGSVKSPVSVMVTEHETATLMQNKLFSLSNGFSCPEGASEVFCELYEKLKEFDQDLHQHVYLENDVLFPRAITLEETLLAS